MGRTVYGVDLEESPFGGFIEKLLTEEELERLADGGAAAGPPGRGTAPDGGSDDVDEDAGVGDASEDVDEDVVTGGADDWTVSDETYGSSEADVDASPADAEPSESFESSAPWSPPPSTEPDDLGGPGQTGLGGGARPEARDGEGDSGGIGGFLSAHKWLLLKLAVAFAAIAAVLVVVWRYKDRLAGVVPGRGGEDGRDELDAETGTGATADTSGGTGGDVSPARRRAKVGEGVGEPEATGEGEGEDVDLGALLGLGLLALVAALVRKFDEERNRPHDPLVDGPLDEDDSGE